MVHYYRASLEKSWFDVVFIGNTVRLLFAVGLTCFHVLDALPVRAPDFRCIRLSFNLFFYLFFSHLRITYKNS